ncbi:MAG TPA: pitrilysin family protein [Halomicronema sp.]
MSHWFYRKKQRFVLLTVAVLVFSFLVGHTPSPAFGNTHGNGTDAKHYTELQFPPLPEINLPDYTRYQLDNGMTVFLMEDRELPLVSGTALFRTGERFEPADKVGLADITGEVMRTGGTTKHTADQLNEILEQKAASVETGISTDAGSASFSALTEDVSEVFELFAEVVRMPVFAADKVDLAKKQRQGGIARRNDDPNDIASREFAKLIYGKNSPYSRTAEYATLANVSREDLVSFHRQYFHPNNMILGIVGDFDSASMRKLIAEKFGDWPVDESFKVPPLPTVSQANNSGIFFVDQPQLTQSSVLLGQLGGQLNSPDYPALTVLNDLLNGFGGRLFNEVRSRQGLAYSVYGVWSPRYDYPGMFIAGGQTRSEATVPFIQGIFNEIKRLRTEMVSPEELAFAKESTLNSFIFNFAEPVRTLSRLMRYEYYGYPNDFIFQYRRGVEATTAEDVLRVAQTYLKPETMVTLVVGNSSQIQPALSSLGSGKKVNLIDITIPEPQS